MKPHRTLALLLLLGAIAILDAGKIENVLKKVGRRYNQQDRRIFFPIVSDDYDYARGQTVNLVGNLLHGQSSKDNEKSEWSATVLSELIRADGFIGSICGEKDLNYVQFIDHLKRARKNFLKNDGEKISRKLVVDTNQGNDYLTFSISFENHHATLGYNVTDTYVIHMEVVVTLQTFGEWGQYWITKILQIGACTEHGGIIPSIKEQLSDLIPSQFMSIFKQHRNGEFSSDWLELLSKENDFSGSVCIEGEPVTLTRNDMINWWKKFSVMYHPPDENYTSLTMIAAEGRKYTFRITVKVQIGYKEDEPVETFDFKLVLNQNEGTFGKIDHFEVMCNLVPRVEKEVMAKHSRVYKDLIVRRLDKLMATTPELWYKFPDALTDLFGPKGFSIDSCELGTTWNETVEIAEREFWAKNKMSNGKIEGYGLNVHESVSSVAVKMSIIIHIKWTPLEPLIRHDSMWKFYLEWDKNLQFFHTTKIFLGCRSEEGKTAYFRFRTEFCRYKHCGAKVKVVPDLKD
ncbi:hypothetical protein GCK72_001730 [Caenorhabditis remanei]|uniref:NTF2-like domain-containing protein n=1 Tax=Caenorhabditis remanei TaxID=31234 RepID=A0A6A5HUJ3_CAERE|nr:hypothetical protein GCK72_001730 [Caenorhabditis remanei]KAF1769913.1 hypothetical protein GCK72_001730 [Caenorhabditis remanei]